MLLKRKRSDSELSFSSASMLSSPPRPCNGAFDLDGFMAMDTDDHGHSSPRARTPAHLPSRTLKRFRDARPSDQEVHRKFYEWRAHLQAPPSLSVSIGSPKFSHVPVFPAEHTLSLLYSAAAQQQQQQPQQHQQQQQPQQQQSSLSLPPHLQNQHQYQHQHQHQLPVTAVPAAPAPAQRSLHSFWKLPGSVTPSPASSTAPSPPVERAALPTNCEDCGVGLGGEDSAMDLDYGLAPSSEEGPWCGACGKAVCFSCSVSNLGEHRRCLACAGRKVWIGGIGWANGTGAEVVC